MTNQFVTNNWPVLVMGVMMIVGAIIDGWKLKVPNWLTFPMIVSGWLYWGMFGWAEIGWSILGAFVAGGLLLGLWLIGGMGGGDAKLYAGFGAWMVPFDWFGFTHLFWAFGISVIVGGIMALGMILLRGSWSVNLSNAKAILEDIQTSGTLGEIKEKAKVRKPSLTLLPYGVPLTIGSLGYLMTFYR